MSENDRKDDDTQDMNEPTAQPQGDGDPGTTAPAKVAEGATE